MNMTSSLSKRLKMRRKPLSRRNSRSISLRRLYQALLYRHGSSRVETGGTTVSTRLEPWRYSKAWYKRRNEIDELFRRLKRASGASSVASTSSTSCSWHSCASSSSSKHWECV